MKLTIKQKRFADEYIIEKPKLRAAAMLIKRYRNFGELVTEEIVKECQTCIGSREKSYASKKAARIILNSKYGVAEAGDMIEGFAVVHERSDSLVLRWKKKVLRRDNVCRECGSTKNLQVHHISHWADDPVNRINPDNGIVLCRHCHALEHPEISGLILLGGDQGD